MDLVLVGWHSLEKYGNEREKSRRIIITLERRPKSCGPQGNKLGEHGVVRNRLRPQKIRHILSLTHAVHSNRGSFPTSLLAYIRLISLKYGGVWRKVPSVRSRRPTPDRPQPAGHV